MRGSKWKAIALCATLFSITRGDNDFPLEKARSSKWAAILRGLSHVESRGNPRAESWLGARHGRGLYQVSEIVLEHSRWRHWYSDAWRGLTPEDLFSPSICGMIAVDQLEYLAAYYGDKAEPMPWILSAYWQGARATDEKGIAWGYVREVLDATNETR